MDYSWRVGETYVKVKGKWACLYRAVDKHGNTVDFSLSSTCSVKAAKRFLAKALKSIRPWAHPQTINTDKAPTFSPAIDELKEQGKCPKDKVRRQVKYLNNIIEIDHGKHKFMCNRADESARTFFFICAPD